MNKNYYRRFGVPRIGYVYYAGGVRNGQGYGLNGSFIGNKYYQQTPTSTALDIASSRGINFPLADSWKQTAAEQQGAKNAANATNNMSGLAKGLGVAGEVANIAGDWIDAAKDVDTTTQEETLATQGNYRFGAQDTNSFINEVNGLNDIEGYSYEDLGGVTNKEIVGGAINGAVSGAQAGASFGPVGAVVGGAVGLFSSLGANVLRRSKTNDAVHELDVKKNQAITQRTNNMYNAAQNINDKNAMFMKRQLAEGGYLDATSGLIEFNAGGSHEQNPLNGVQQGVAPDGQPNLVEEGETRWGDYIFSKRLKPSKSLLKEFFIADDKSAFDGMSFAEVSKQLAEDCGYAASPTDPIAIETFSTMMDRLQNAQEAYKQRSEEHKMAKAVDNMSDADKAAMMQQVMMQQQGDAQQMNPMQQMMQPQAGFAKGGHVFQRAGTMRYQYPMATQQFMGADNTAVVPQSYKSAYESPYVSIEPDVAAVYNLPAVNITSGYPYRHYATGDDGLTYSYDANGDIEGVVNIGIAPSADRRVGFMRRTPNFKRYKASRMIKHNAENTRAQVNYLLDERAKAEAALSKKNISERTARKLNDKIDDIDEALFVDFKYNPQASKYFEDLESTIATSKANIKKYRPRWAWLNRGIKGLGYSSAVGLPAGELYLGYDYLKKAKDDRKQNYGYELIPDDSTFKPQQDDYSDINTYARGGHLFATGTPSPAPSQSVPGSNLSRSREQWLIKHYERWLKVLQSNGYYGSQAQRIASYLTLQDAFESKYGESVYATRTSNYGGMQINGKNIDYSSKPERYYTDKLHMLQKKFPGFATARNRDEFIKALVGGTYKYFTANPDIYMADMTSAVNVLRNYQQNSQQSQQKQQSTQQQRTSAQSTQQQRTSAQSTQQQRTSAQSTNLPIPSRGNYNSDKKYEDEMLRWYTYVNGDYDHNVFYRFGTNDINASTYKEFMKNFPNANKLSMHQRIALISTILPEKLESKEVLQKAYPKLYKAAQQGDLQKVSREIPYYVTHNYYESRAMFDTPDDVDIHERYFFGNIKNLNEAQYAKIMRGKTGNPYAYTVRNHGRYTTNFTKAAQQNTTRTLQQAAEARQQNTTRTLQQAAEARQQNTTRTLQQAAEARQQQSQVQSQQNVEEINMVIPRNEFDDLIGFVPKNEHILDFERKETPYIDEDIVNQNKRERQRHLNAYNAGLDRLYEAKRNGKLLNPEIVDVTETSAPRMPGSIVRTHDDLLYAYKTMPRLKFDRGNGSGTITPKNIDYFNYYNSEDGEYDNGYLSLVQHFDEFPQALQDAVLAQMSLYPGYDSGRQWNADKLIDEATDLSLGPAHQEFGILYSLYQSMLRAGVPVPMFTTGNENLELYEAMPNEDYIINEIDEMSKPEDASESSYSDTTYDQRERRSVADRYEFGEQEQPLDSPLEPTKPSVLTTYRDDEPKKDEPLESDVDANTNTETGSYSTVETSLDADTNINITGNHDNKHKDKTRVRRDFDPSVSRDAPAGEFEIQHQQGKPQQDASFYGYDYNHMSGLDAPEDLTEPIPIEDVSETEEPVDLTEPIPIKYVSETEEPVDLTAPTPRDSSEYLQAIQQSIDKIPEKQDGRFKQWLTSSKDFDPSVLRYAPAVGSGLSMIADWFGVNEPDYTNADMIMRNIPSPKYVGYNPVGLYQRWMPADREYRLAQMAQQTANARNIAGFNSNAATARANMLAMNNTALGNYGEFAVKTNTQNNSDRNAVIAANNQLDLSNSENAMKASVQNQSAYDNWAARRMDAITKAATMREAIDEASAKAKNSNRTAFVNDLGTIGTEEAYMQMMHDYPYWIGRDGNVNFNYRYDGTTYEQLKAQQEEEARRAAAQQAVSTTHGGTGAYGGKIGFARRKGGFIVR